MITTGLETSRASAITLDYERAIPLPVYHAGNGFMGHPFCCALSVGCSAEANTKA